MLSISEFSQMCHLSPQALRFYHAEGLLVPAGIDDRTGHRSYAFDQVERAMLITLLRDTGMSVKLVRRALDEPDQAVALLDRHSDEVSRQRQAQADAIAAARAVFEAQPEPRLRHVPATTAVARLVPGTPLGRDAQEWDRAEEIITAAAADLVTTVRQAGVTCRGEPWRTLALETPEQDRRVLDGTGPFWTVKVAVDGTPETLPSLPAGLIVQTPDAHDELSIFMPGRNTMAKYCTVVLRLLDAAPVDGDRFVNLARLRQEVRPDGVLSSAPVERRPGSPTEDLER
ncbi:MULTISPECIES: MerR family transcriptional regulator [Micromonospora]|uniref:MerR family transcriptional regulator n=1 Tax=Micromonospora aurantiaca (nom. illeg.) TaxID=47850 RepID=A0A6N3K1S0_9ACTN|nr:MULTISPECIES: MerR family transcriptional regulator [Micromonospora]AXH90949.1 MerR family transcriptional regulator [Micromonospora aurantiaca]OHX03906.1 MerR family transcriptional regulator [Micromonospora sp. WMMB235]